MIKRKMCKRTNTRSDLNGRQTYHSNGGRSGGARGTVDRVLNNRPHVNEEVRQRVLEAVRETGYVPLSGRRQTGVAARSLTLGILLPNWEGQFRAEVDRGIRRACAELEEANVRVLLRRCETDLPQEALRLLEDMRRDGAEGFAVCAVNDPSVERWIAARAAEGTPCVTFNSDLPASGRLCFVGQDIDQAGHVAAGLLHKCVSGHCGKPEVRRPPAAAGRAGLSRRTNPCPRDLQRLRNHTAGRAGNAGGAAGTAGRLYGQSQCLRLLRRPGASGKNGTGPCGLPRCQRGNPPVNPLRGRGFYHPSRSGESGVRPPSFAERPPPKKDGPGKPPWANSNSLRGKSGLDLL